MTRTRRTQLFTAAAMALLLSLAVAGVYAYEKPKGGAWKLTASFGDIKGGSMKISSDGRTLKKFKVNVGADDAEACGAGKVKLRGKLPIKRYKRFNGRYAVAKVRGGLFAPRRAKLKADRTRLRGKIEILFDETGKFANSGRLELRQCSLDFYGRPR